MRTRDRELSYDMNAFFLYFFFIFYLLTRSQVGEVCDFIRGLPGCADYAEDFAIQEIDGQALVLLKANHLMSAMSIRLGPALKIVGAIDSMRLDSNLSPSDPSCDDPETDN